jgi:hypothetical protein
MNGIVYGIQLILLIFINIKKIVEFLQLSIVFLLNKYINHLTTTL